MSKYWLPRALFVGLLCAVAQPSFAADPQEAPAKSERQKAKEGNDGKRAQRLKKQAKKMEQRAKQLRKEGKADEAARLEARARKLRKSAAGAEPDRRGKPKSPEAERRERKFKKLRILKRKYGKKLDDASVQEELGRHAERLAKLRRMQALAEEGGKAPLVARIETLKATEDARHEAAMASLLGKEPTEGEGSAQPGEKAQ